MPRRRSTYQRPTIRNWFGYWSTQYGRQMVEPRPSSQQQLVVLTTS